MMRAMTLLDSLQTAWITVGVPGTEYDDGGTYATYDREALPELPREVLEDPKLSWLRALAPAGEGMSPTSFHHATTPLTADGLEQLLSAVGLDPDALPRDLRALADPQVHARLWSATDAYLDAGDFLEAVPGGHLLHLVSDSQWVLHWYAFLGEDGSSGVVCAADSLGYEGYEGEKPARFDPEQAAWVADSVRELVWRWWADNFAFAAANPDICPELEAPAWFDLAAYVAGYRAS